MALVSILSQIKLVFGPLVILLVSYTKTIIHFSVGESGGYLPRRFVGKIFISIHLHFGE